MSHSGVVRASLHNCMKAAVLISIIRLIPLFPLHAVYFFTFHFSYHCYKLCHQRQTQATLTQRMVNTAKMTFDFGPLLLFPWIEQVTYSLSFANGEQLVQHAAMEPEGTSVDIVTASPTTATVTVSVAQCVKK